MFLSMFAQLSPDDAIKQWTVVERDPKTMIPVSHGQLSPRVVEDAGNVGRTETMKKSVSGRNIAVTESKSFSSIVAPVSPRKDKDAEVAVPEGAKKVDPSKTKAAKKVSCVMEVPKDSRLTTDRTIKITIKADSAVPELHKKLTGNIRGPDKKRIRITLSGTSERTPGVARLSFSPDVPGDYIITISYNGLEIINSPYALHVKRGKSAEDGGEKEPSSPVTSPRVLDDDKEEEKTPKKPTSSVKQEEAKQRHHRLSNQRHEAIEKAREKAGKETKEQDKEKGKEKEKKEPSK